MREQCRNENAHSRKRALLIVATYIKQCPNCNPCPGGCPCTIPTITGSTQVYYISEAFSYSIPYTVDGNTPTFTIQSGSLPSGFSLNSSTGVVSGTSTDSAKTATIRITTCCGYAEASFTFRPADNTELCALNTSGGNEGYDRYFIISATQSFTITWNFETIHDRLYLLVNNVLVLFDTGCVGGTGTSGTLTVTPPADFFLHIQLFPHCDSGSDTIWSMHVTCL